MDATYVLALLSILVLGLIFVVTAPKYAVVTGGLVLTIGYGLTWLPAGRYTTVLGVAVLAAGIMSRAGARRAPSRPALVAFIPLLLGVVGLGLSLLTGARRAVVTEAAITIAMGLVVVVGPAGCLPRGL